MKLRLFFCGVVLSTLALAPPALASPMVSHAGGAQVMLSLSPDPPQPGPEHATVTATGASLDSLSRTTVGFASQMPVMSMRGSAGAARAVPGQIGVWKFDLPTAMATQWLVALKFSGGVNGSATFSFGVAGAGGADAMNMSGGNGSAWRVAALALAILFILAAAIAWSMAKSRSPSERPKWLTPSTATLTIAAVVVVLGIALLQSRFAPPAMDMASMSNVSGTAPIPVTLATVRTGGSGTTIVAPGIIQAYLTQDVSARTPGIVQSVNAYVGDKVTAGQTLATLSEPDLGAQAAAAGAAAQSDQNAATVAMIEAHHHAPNELIIAQEDAKAKAEQARFWRTELIREKSLLAAGGVSPQEYEDERAQAAVAAATAAAAQHQVMDARANIEMTAAAAAAALARASSSSAVAQSILAGYTTLTAPDDAVVVARLVDPGSYVQSGTPILRVAVIRKLRIQANVAQQDLVGIEVGTALVATVEGGPTVRAIVTAVQPAADPTAHTAMIEAVVDNPGYRLRPGTYARVVIGPIAAARTRGVAAPSASVVGSGQEAAVWTDINGAAHQISVTVLSDDGRTAIVRGDVKSGDRVVVDGAQDLQEGAPIVEARP